MGGRKVGFLYKDEKGLDDAISGVVRTTLANLDMDAEVEGAFLQPR